MAEKTVRIEGINELQRAFSKLSRDLGRGVKEALEGAAEPIRSQASTNVQSSISGMARSRIPWWRMRTGITAHSVYIAPEQRGVKSGRIADRRRRPNLVAPMATQMEKALADNREDVIDNFDDELGELFRRWERV